MKFENIYESHEKIEITMEMCKGGELFDIVLGANRLQEKELAIVAHQILLALRSLNKQNLAHT